MMEARPFGEWSPKLSGLIPTSPPPALVEPPVAEVLFTYESMKEYRLVGTPYVVKANYDSINSSVESGIAELIKRHFVDWQVWVERNL